MISIDVSEVRALAADMIASADRAPARVQPAVTRCGFRTVAFSQVLAPVDTGALKSSISVDIGDLEFEAGPGVEYGAYVELGTSRMGPQPYLGPGFDRAVEASMGDFADAAGDVW